MRIVHLSYQRVNAHSNPETWLKKLEFFTVGLEKMALFGDVASIHLIHYSGVVKKNGVTYHFLKVGKWSLLFPSEIHSYVGKLQPDVVMVHGLIFPWQVLQLRMHLQRSVRIVAVHHAEKPFRNPKALLHRLADSHIDAYFFSAASLGKQWVDALQIGDPSKIHEVMIGSSKFYQMDRQIAKRKTKVGDSATYLWVGHLNSNKDPITVVSAFIQFVESYPEARLYMFYLDDMLINEVKALTAGCEQIALVGHVDHDDLLYWFNAADFIISSSFYEGGGVAVCEGISCGCIPILTDIPPFRMMTDNGACGFLFQPGNVAELLLALCKSALIDVSAERKKVMDRFNEKLSSEATARKMVLVMQDLLGARR